EGLRRATVHDCKLGGPEGCVDCAPRRRGGFRMKEPKGKDVSEVRVSRGGRPLRPSRLKELGYTPNEVDSRGRIRSYRDPSGKVVSKYRAYKALGLPMLNAREWRRIDALEGRARSRALKEKGFK